MLTLTDPLWKKLDEAHRDLDIPGVLAGLADSWDHEVASSLFWDNLCHQDTCYGATFAAIPHLLNIAAPDKNKNQRLEIAIFLGCVARSAFDVRHAPSGGLEMAPPQGLPGTIEAWDRKLDAIRGIVARADDLERADRGFFHHERLASFREILALDPVDEADLAKIAAIRDEFFRALPDIRSLSQRASHENTEDEGIQRYLLSGVSAGVGLLELADDSPRPSLGILLRHFLGRFVCSKCDAQCPERGA